MAAQTFPISTEFQEFVASRVASGRYANPAEVLAAAQSALTEAERDDDLHVDYVRQAIAEGEASGYVDGKEAMAEIRRRLRLPATGR